MYKNDVAKSLFSHYLFITNIFYIA